MTRLLISSAPARKDTKLAIMDCFRNSQLFELYGSTEQGWATLLRPAWCANRIAGYKRPKAVSFVADAEMPRTATGKILHRVLKARYDRDA